MTERMHKLSISFSDQELAYIKQLHRTGVYGATEEEAVHTLIMERIREEVRASGLLNLWGDGKTIRTK